MPLYGYTCPSCGSTLDALVRMSDADRPQACRSCGAAMAKDVSKVAAGIVAGHRGPGEGPRRESGAAPKGSTILMETPTTIVRSRGNGMILVDYHCDRCAKDDVHVFERERPAELTCETCGDPVDEIIGMPSVDWFTKQYAAAGGYFDRGLGCFVTSAGHRRQIMAERNLVEFGDVGEIHEDYQRKKRQEAAESDAEIRGMLRGFETGPDAAAMKLARDRGTIQPWDWAVEAVGGLDRD